MLQVCSLLAVFRHHAKLTGDLAFYLTKNQASLEAALPKRCAILCDNFASFSGTYAGLLIQAMGQKGAHAHFW